MPASPIPVAPGAIPVLGHALRLRDNPLEFFESLRALGDVVLIKLGPQRAYVLNSAELVRELLVAKSRHFDKGTQIDSARDLLGYGLISSEGEMHRQHRLLMQPAFRRDRIAEYAQVMREQIVEHTADWHTGRVIDVRVEMTTLTLSVAAKTLISAELGNDLVAEMLHSMPRIFDLLYQRMTTPLPVSNKLPLKRNREYAARLARLHPMIDKVVADYRSSDDRKPDLLGMLLEARDAETGSVLSDRELHDQITAILMAGSETTAAALSWVFHLLPDHPEVEARLHAEADRVLDGRPAEYADVRQLTYTAQVINEALRYYPPAWLATRRATEDVDLKDLHVPAGATVIFSAYVVQRDPRLFSDPDEFDPDRWSPERVGEIHRDAIVQFGGGPRKCIGDVFAVVEATLALATIAAQWRLRVAPGVRMAKVAGSTLSPRDLMMTVEQRQPAQQPTSIS